MPSDIYRKICRSTCVKKLGDSEAIDACTEYCTSIVRYVVFRVWLVRTLMEKRHQ